LVAAVNADDVATFERCIAVGGVALFPSDTVYGLATEPESKEGVQRLYRLKGRRPDKPTAVMFFDRELAFAALPDLPGPTADATKRLLPGPVTLLLPNPTRRFPLACGPTPDVLGLRVPDCGAELGSVKWPVLQSSANVSAGPEAQRLDDVDATIRAGVDMILDGGELPGTPSTVLDLTRYHEDRSYNVIRLGAMSEAQVRQRLGDAVR
jgi:L-threonylcarbamoyladenylate synthase